MALFQVKEKGRTNQREAQQHQGEGKRKETEGAWAWATQKTCRTLLFGVARQEREIRRREGQPQQVVVKLHERSASVLSNI